LLQYNRHRSLRRNPADTAMVILIEDEITDDEDTGGTEI
jgi:hypothetical protein